MIRISFLICCWKSKVHTEEMGNETTEFNLPSSLGKHNPEKLSCCETLCSTASCAIKFLCDSRQVTQISVFKANNVLSFLWVLDLRVCISLHVWPETPDFSRIKWISWLGRWRASQKAQVLWNNQIAAAWCCAFEKGTSD